MHLTFYLGKPKVKRKRGGSEDSMDGGGGAREKRVERGLIPPKKVNDRQIFDFGDIICRQYCRQLNKYLDCDEMKEGGMKRGTVRRDSREQK
jgi:hypothetical protein